ncbi:MAG: MBL fold metallo-hydrolase RNA specificity domain-containing protein, partial [Candidatus Woesearchaeota archaeon]|nr:MBL fold metallo-hydrolase RNA specificity domain-containing protein [Candidatus Woesearchaeota archaeon]
SSHIARLTTIVDLAEKLKRKVVFLGRSLAKYALAAEDSGVTQFTSRGVKILKYGRQVRQVMKDLMDNRDKYVIVMTGHQGEPKAMLSKIVQNMYPFRIKAEDHIIFSCITIPAEINLKNREHLESELKKIGVRMFTNIHVSGHCAREDLRDVIMMLKPKHLLPIHGEKPMNDAMIDLGAEQGYKLGKTSHALKEGERISLE